jgi:hypothetical protein
MSPAASPTEVLGVEACPWGIRLAPDGQAGSSLAKSESGFWKLQ